MSDNILEPLVDCLVDSAKILFKCIGSIFDFNTIDFKKLFEEIGLCNKSKEYPKLIKTVEEKHYKIYQFSTPIGLCESDFKSKIDAISHFLEVDSVSISRNKSFVEVKVLTSIPYESYDPEIHKCKEYKVPLGINLNNHKIRYWDIGDSANANIYIAGTTRCGKSNLLRLIMTVLTQKSCADVQFSLINPKIVDLIEYKEVKNVVHYTENPYDAVGILEENLEEMDRRYKLFARNSGVKNIWDYRKKVGKMPVRLVVVEEIATFEEDEEFHERLRLISQKAAGSGIFLVLTTQLPNAKNLPNSTKNNINTVIGGKCKDSIRSDIIVENGDLHLLKGKGHMKIFDAEEYGTEIQSFYIDDAIVERITSENISKLKNAK